MNGNMPNYRGDKPKRNHEPEEPVPMGCLANVISVIGIFVVGVFVFAGLVLSTCFLQ